MPALRRRHRARAALAIALTAVAGAAAGAVFGDDDRRAWHAADGILRPARARTELGLRAIGATGGVRCADGALFSGFLVDVSAHAPGFAGGVLMTTAHTFVDEHGRSRGPCRFLGRDAASRPYVLAFVHTGLGPGAVRKPADGRDWAFALLDDYVPGALPEAPLSFGGAHDFPREAAGAGDWMAVSWSARRGRVEWASRCRPDDKAGYPEFAATPADAADFTRMIVHDCDFAAGGSGGPLLKRLARGWHVVGLHVGDTGRAKRGASGTAWYAPPASFNFSRRLDAGIERALVDYLEVVRHARPRIE